MNLYSKEVRFSALMSPIKHVLSDLSARLPFITGQVQSNGLYCYSI